MRTLIFTLALLLGGCSHHPLSCAIGLPYDDCLAGTSGAEAWRQGKRIDPMAEMALMNYTSGVQGAALATQLHTSDSLMRSLSPPVVVYRPY